MTPDKFVIKCPTQEPERCRGVDMELALEEIKFSKHCLVFYESYNKGCKTMFTGYNKEVFSMLVLLLAESKTSFDFFKLAIVTVEKLGSERKKKSNDAFLKEIEGFVSIYFGKGNSIYHI